MKREYQNNSVATNSLHPLLVIWLCIIALNLFPVFNVFSQGTNPDMKQGSTRTILSLKSVGMDLGVVNYPCLERQYCFFILPSQCCVLADSTVPVGPAYRFYQMGIENWIISSTKSYAYVLGADIQLEHFRNHALPYDAVRVNLHAFFGVEGNKTFGFRAGLRIGQNTRNVDHQEKTKLSLTGRMWFGTKPIAVIQVGFLDNPVAGINVSAFYSLLDINASRLHRKYMGRFRAGISSVYENALYYFWDIEFKPFKNLILVPTVTYIPQTEIGSSEVGYGLGVKYIFE